MKPHSSRVKKWHSWLRRINDQITYLYAYVKIRRDLGLIIERSDVRHTSDLFWQYLHVSLTNELIVRITRLCEKQSANRSRSRRIWSLVALLQEFHDYNDYFTRRRFVGRMNPPPYDPGIESQEGWREETTRERFFSRNRHFDELVGRGIDCLSKAAVLRDIQQLQEAVDRLRTYRHKFIAHNDLFQRSRRAPNYSELPVALDTIAEIAKKYHALLHHHEYHHQLVGPYSDVPSLFSRSWISSREELEKIRDLCSE